MSFSKYPFLPVTLLFIAPSMTFAQAPTVAGSEKEYPPVLDFKMKTLDDQKVHLGERYAGKVVLLVNVASKCGYTPQYEALQELHEKYAEQGLAIVGVPCNQFGGQEPGSAEEIATFCEENYGVAFDMLAKVDVKGDDPAPLYEYLTSKKTNPKHAGPVKWNFEKFLISRDGEAVMRWRSRTAPTSEEVVEAIEEELGREAE